MHSRTILMGTHLALIVLGLPLLSAANEPIAQIVFHSDRDGNPEIYRVDADGSNEIRLTNHIAVDAFPSWSPDGKQILFQSDRNGDDAIYVMNVDGTEPKQIPNTDSGRYAKWSHDGRKIAFFAMRDGNTDLFVIDANGNNLHRLTSHAATDETPSWAANGSRLAFQSDRNDPRPGIRRSDEWEFNFGIFTIDADGGDIQEITGLDFNDENPSISPDGRQIVYQSYLEDSLGIVKIDISTQHRTILTDLSAISGSPAWSSDGKHIIFDSNRDGNFEIFVMNADGSNQCQLTFTDDGENSGAAMYSP